MIKFTTFSFLFCLSWAVPTLGQADDRATYVGGGRYVGQDRTSTNTAILRQRNQDLTERRQDRDRSEQRYQESERRERSYERDYSDRY